MASRRRKRAPGQPWPARERRTYWFNGASAVLTVYGCNRFQQPSGLVVFGYWGKFEGIGVRDDEQFACVWEGHVPGDPETKLRIQPTWAFSQAKSLASRLPTSKTAETTA